ncbi:MAG: sortase [Aggregatilineales bacterium]
MRDKRPIDELSIEELERVLAIKKREARQQQLDRMRRSGRVIEPQSPPETLTANIEPEPQIVPQVIEPEPDPAPFALPFEPGAETLAQTRAPKREPVKPQKATPPPMPKVRTPASRNKPTGAPRFEDDPLAAEAVIGQSRRRNSAWQAFMNRSLLLVEVAAVAGLIFIGVNMVGAINELQTETANSQRAANEDRLALVPTLEPTPTLRIGDVVLPSGHTIVNNTPRFNEDEVPSHLRVRIQDEIYRPIVRRPEPSSETAIALYIPRLGINETIIQGTDWEALRQGVGQVQNGANPTDIGTNVVLAAHNDIYGELFRYLDELEPGDEFQIRTQTQTFTYRISGWDIFDPTDVHVMDNQPGVATATLISCYPYQVSDQRIVVFAERVDGGDA